MSETRPITAARSPLRALGDSGIDPLLWEPQRRGVPSAWWGHVPFAHWLVAATRPRLFVELGSHQGVSYAAFCQAVERSGLATRCYAVDTWAGDAHTWGYGKSVYDELRAFHEPRYAGFSTLLRMTFDDALAEFDDGSVDLLHIDGLHTYDAVSHDFATWRPKLSDRAVVLFHDTAERQRDFGVWRLWQELSARYPHFEFHHSHGLGVLAVGRDVPPDLAELCAATGTEAGDTLRSHIARLGERWMMDPKTNGAIAGAAGNRSLFGGLLRRAVKLGWWSMTGQLPGRLREWRASRAER